MKPYKQRVKEKTQHPNNHYPRIKDNGKCDICGHSESEHKLDLKDLII